MTFGDCKKTSKVGEGRGEGGVFNHFLMSVADIFFSLISFCTFDLQGRKSFAFIRKNYFSILFLLVSKAKFLIQLEIISSV